jgi:HAE1 family hydrophobic/amphiphilic exporter-1
MARIWIFFTEKTALSYLILTALVIFGLFSALSINRESAPEVQIPIAVISSVLPGASPEDVETLIVEELEGAVANISNIKKLTSTSRKGVGTVVVEFEASADIDESIDEVKDEVDKVKGNLPDDATDPFVTDVNFSDQPVVIASIVSDLPVTEFKKAADRLVDDIEGISGVSRAEVTGVRDREVTVVVQKENLLAFNVSLDQIVRAVSQNNITAPVGAIQVDGVEYPIELKGRIEDTSTVADIPITTSNGAVLKLSDVAFISDGVEDANTISRVSENGEPPYQAATLLIYKQRGADITRLSKDIDTLIEEKGNGTSNTEIVITYDAGENIINDLTRLTRTGLQTVALVLLVLFLALGIRPALIASLSIPLSFLTAITVMNATGNTINFISLFSLILAIGILIDTAIVITEAIYTNNKKGLSKREAVRTAITEFHYPVTTGNLTTIAVFFPLFTISGVTGEFIDSIPFTVIAVLVSSLIISLAFIPLIASTFLHVDTTTEKVNKQEMYAEKMRAWYRKRIPWLLDSRKRKIWFVISLTALFIVLVTLPFFGIIRVSFFPQSDVDFVYLNLEEPQGTPLERTDFRIRPVEDILLTIPEIESFTTTIGAGSAFDQSPSSGPRFGSITVNLKKERERSSTELLEYIEGQLDEYNDLDVQVFQPSEGPPSGAPVLVTFFGDDIEELKKLANTAAGILRDIEGTRTVTSSGADDANEFALTIDREKTASLGLSPAVIANTLRTAVFGTEATTIKTNGDEIDVVVKLNLNTQSRTAHDTNHTTLDRIAELPIVTPQGTILLGSVLTSSLEASSDVISREDEKRIATASSQVAEGFIGREVAMEFEKRFDEAVTLPEGVTMKLGGETEDVDQSFKDMFRALGMGVIFVFGVLVVQFNRFRQAFIVLSVVPLSLIGVLLGLLITREYLSFPSMLGFIALAGIVVNNAIILVDVWNRMRKTELTMSLRDVVIEGAALRLRPILLTTVTTIVGIAPLIFASDLWRPIAVSIMFGLLFAVVLTLLMVPILYLKLCKKPHKSTASEKIVRPPKDDELETRSMEHIGDVMKKRFSPHVVKNKIMSILFAVVLLSVPQYSHAFIYTQENIKTSYHEKPAHFEVTTEGEMMGATVSGIPIRQRNISNDLGIRLQRFEIGLAHWYISDEGIIWAEDDITALSIYLSRIA